MTNLDSVLNSRDITLLMKFCIVKAMVFLVVTYRCESWTIKKVEHQRMMLLNCGAEEEFRVPWHARSNQSILNENNPEYSLGRTDAETESSNTLATQCKELVHWKRPWWWERLRAGEERAIEDEMVGWHHWLTGHEFEQTQGDGEVQETLLRHSPQGHKELDTTEQLNNKLYISIPYYSLP